METFGVLVRADLNFLLHFQGAQSGSPSFYFVSHRVGGLICFTPSFGIFSRYIFGLVFFRFFPELRNRIDLSPKEEGDPGKPV